jgi:tripartite-type tricarboxylate transporter receptor subunit TctC
VSHKRFVTRFPAITLGLLLCLTLTSPLWGQQPYPTKPINILIGFSPGGNVDVTTRALVGKTEKFLGQPIIISNNGGGGGSVAAGIVAKQKPDGYYMLGSTTTQHCRIPQYRSVPYTLDDFVPIMQHTTTESGLAVRTDSPFKTLKDLVEYARQNPGKATYSTLGVGSPMHLSMEYIAKQEGITWTHVPYPGNMPAVTAMLGGHVTATSSSTEWKPYVLEGRVRVLVTHGEKRMQSFPNVPTMKELGYDFYNDTTFIIMAPKGTPAPIVKKLEDALHKAQMDPEFRALLTRIDHVPAYRNSEETRRFLEEAYKANGKWIAELKIPKEDEQKK